MDFNTLTMLWIICMVSAIVIAVLGSVTNKFGFRSYSDEELAEIEQYYNEHGTVPKWVITGHRN